MPANCVSPEQLQALLKGDLPEAEQEIILAGQLASESEVRRFRTEAEAVAMLDQAPPHVELGRWRRMITMKSFIALINTGTVIWAAIFVTGCATPDSPAPQREVPERWNFILDSRPWQLGYQAADARQAIREYVLPGQTVQSWSELVTSQYFPDGPAPRALFDQTRQDLSRGCPSLQVSVIEETADTIIFEWRHDGCQGHPAQHEIRRISTGRTGTVSLSFVERTRQLAADKQTKWISILKSATIRPDA